MVPTCIQLGLHCQDRIECLKVLTMPWLIMILSILKFPVSIVSSIFLGASILLFLALKLALGVVHLCTYTAPKNPRSLD